MQKENKKVSIAYFGGYECLYSRVITTLKGLRENNVKVYECRSRHPIILLRLISLSWQYLKIFRRINILMVCEAGQSYVPLAKILALLTGKLLVFDAFISQYHVNVLERKKCSKKSIRAIWYYYLDKVACILPDLVFLDSPEHIDYFCKLFDFSKRKFSYFPIGADNEIFFPCEKEKTNSVPQVLFWGSFLPLHGVEYIVRAAKILENRKIKIGVVMIGDGMLRSGAEKLALKLKVRNLRFKNFIHYKKLSEIIIKSDICLGQFSGSKQVQIVIPIKVYEAAAMRKPIITGFSSAVNRFFKHKKNIYFCEIENSESLADGIENILKSKKLADGISEGGYRTYKKNFTPDKIGKKIIKDLTNLIEK